MTITDCKIKYEAVIQHNAQRRHKKPQEQVNVEQDVKFLFVFRRLELTMGSPRTPGDCMLTIVNTSVKFFFQNSLPSFSRMVVKSLSSQRDISAPINSLPPALPLTSNCGSRGSFDIFGSVPRLVPRSRRE